MTVATFDLKVDCQNCTDSVKRSRGCDFDIDNNEFEFEGEFLKRCPLRLITPLSRDLIKFHNYMEKGFLPNGGSILKQPAKFLDAMDVIDQAIAKLDEERRKQK